MDALYPPHESRASTLLNRLALGMRRVTADVDEVGPVAVVAAIPLMFVAVPTFFYGRFVVTTQAELYMNAGAPEAQAYGGAVASHAFAVAAVVYAVVQLHRHRFSVPRTALAVSGGLLLLFALLPGLVAVEFWLTTVLGALLTLPFDLLVGGLASLVALRMVRPHPAGAVPPASDPSIATADPAAS
ncbi:hypothetical protein GA0070616_0019 [Micromonospora nigra]|uniref:Uncharacterized protein n=2 Tax=Micromonospora nigra TaxID=145857 RepID=A0A1C6R702_9ACTN|nr:hypothetical protein GA0070616_0019 [Micromonospora nigra]